MDSLEDRAVLVTLFNTLDGENWKKKTHWLSDQPIRSWHGVVSDADGRVTKLFLDNNELNGEIPSELGTLAKLDGLDLAANQLTGDIPKELGRLTNLRDLLLPQNQLSGDIPKELGQLSNLWWLRLSDNQLTGEIPEKLGELSELSILDLGYNQLTGEIPEELSDLTKLQALHLEGNRLTGNVPEVLGNLSALGGLHLRRNLLNGEIPAALGNLTRLSRLDLSDNKLTGEIPLALGNLTRLYYLSLSNNQLTGEIPEVLGNLSELQELHLEGNELTGCVPERLRTVFPYHFSGLGLPFCDVLLSALTVNPGSLVPPFDPYSTEYTIAVGRSNVTVVPFNDRAASIFVLDENHNRVEDADDSLSGHQFEFSADIPAIKIRLVSADDQATRTYTVADLGIRYDANDNGVIERVEVISAIIDYFDELINREEVIGVIRLYFSS